MSLPEHVSPEASSISPSRKPLRYSYPVYVSLAVSLALMGDALLYGVLPTQAAHLGIPLVFVGVLLSANRFIRLVTNTWAASVYRRLGQEKPFVVAMLVASFTTLAYSVPWGPWFFLLARIAWGVCWSFLSLGMYFAVLTHTEAHQRGQWMGKTKSISRLGTIAAVSIGGYLTDLIGFRAVTAALGVVALGGTWLAYRAMWPGGAGTKPLLPPWEGDATSGNNLASALEQPPASHRAGRPQIAKTAQRPPVMIYVMGFVFGFVMHGVVVGTMALLITQRYGTAVALLGMTIGAATASGSLLAMRWVVEILLSPTSGRLGDRFGTDRVVYWTALTLAATLASISFVHAAHWLLPLACLAFLAGVSLSVCLDAVAGTAAVEHNNVSRMMSRYVTAQDLGAAIGPLAGYLVGTGMGLDGFYRVAAIALMVVAALFAMQARWGKQGVGAG